jgi:cysteine synthase
VVAEHELSPILAATPVIGRLKGDSAARELQSLYRLPTEHVPHWILGPHYDELNQLLPPGDTAQIDSVVRYDDATWQSMSQRGIRTGMSVGNSSAANLAVAEAIANQGRTVLTFLYEPLRPFYLRSKREALANI